MSDLPRPPALSSTVERARACFRSEVTLPLAFRVEKLRALDAAIRAHEAKLFDALKADLGKPPHEAYPAEVGLVYAEIRHALASLKSWLKPRRFSVPLTLFPAQSWQQPEPLGTTLIISPWNYPFQLAASPLVGAIAAGCTAVVKPSELSPATSAVLEQVLVSAFGKDGYVSVVQGGAEVSQALLAEKWDLIFFTGSTRVGQVVMEAAAKHLTPTVLELGGKSPCLVDADTDLTTTARRLAWGKFYNAGQTCVAPDYVLVHRDVKAQLVEALKAELKAFFGEDPAKSADYGRIITPRHLTRLAGLMKGGRVVHGGQVDEATRFLAPTLLEDVDLAHPLMQEEIFGPLLPILPVANLDEAVRFTRERPRPLALYVFTRDAQRAEDVLRRAPSGGAMINDTILHVAAGGLPFGGVGESGTGAYHGQASFDAFTHWRSVVKKPFFMDLKVRYPPYTTPLDVMRKLIR